MSRFATADAPGWTPPDEEELRRHFDDRYLSLVPPDWLTRLFTTVAERLRGDLFAVQAEPLYLRARVTDLRIEAETGADPPHRLRSLRIYPLETKAEDPRVATPTTRTHGPVPQEAVDVAGSPSPSTAW
jgi:hypothetical protein